jgi:hypothetical protein
MTKLRSRRRKYADLGMCPTPDRLWKRVCGTNLQPLLEMDPAFSAAHIIHGGNPFVRFELQSRILANQVQVEIAAKMGLSLDVIATYEDFWWNVRDRLEATSWITHEAIQRRPSGELLPSDIGPFWRWIGFHFGSAVLESFLAAATPETLCAIGLDCYWQKDSPLNVDLKLLVLAQRLPIPKTEKEWIRLTRCQELLWEIQNVRTEDLASPLTLEMSPFSEAEVTGPSIESRSSSNVDAVDDRTDIFDVKSCPVVQSLVA